MKFKQIIPGVMVMALAATVSLPASAGFVVLDGWELVSTGADTTNIGRLNLVSGSATVIQQINGAGNVFVGAKFLESGDIFSISYTKENVVGPLDVGAPQPLPTTYTLAFTNVTGHVDALVGTGFHFVFDSGDYSITGGAGGSATGSIVGLDGTSGSSSTISGTTGATTVVGNILSTVAIFDFKDSLGNSLLTDLATGKVLFTATTNNQITGATSVGACPVPLTGNCATLNTASAGDAYLVRVLPEPGVLALLGVVFGAAGVFRRRRV